MPNRSKLYSIVLFVLVITNLSRPQFPDFKFEHINESHNLSHSTVLDIIQDKEGFIWFGTIDGLNRFDGYTCKVFKHDDKDSTSISSNFIHGLHLDSNGDLWISTRDGGLNKFNKFTETFKSYLHDPNDLNSISSNKVATILQDKKGTYWVSGDGGLDKFDPQTGIFKHINLVNKNKNRKIDVSVDRAYVDDSDILWIFSPEGIIKFDPANNSVRVFRSDENNSNSLNDNFIHSVFKENNSLWITTRGGGLTEFNLRTEKFKVYYPGLDKKSKKENIIFGEIFPYSDNILLIGSTENGLYMFDKKKKIFNSIKSHPENSFSISNNHISTIYKDRQNILWIGTWGGGVNKAISKRLKFKKYSKNPFNKNSISGSSVFAVLKDKENNIWIGTTNGIDKLDHSSNLITHFNFIKNTKDVFGTNIYGVIYQDIQGNLWFASDSLIKVDIRSNKREYFSFDPSDPNTISSNNIKCIVSDRNGNIWIGLEDGLGGICKYDLKEKKWTRYLVNENYPLLVRYIFEDSNGNYWLGTTKDGLIKFNINTGDTTTYKNNPEYPYSLSYNDVRQIMETKNGELWLATYGGGICRFDPESEKFYTVKEKNGLSNNFTYAILEDKNENLWISTNYGITKYNRKNNSFKIFTVEDGLQNNEFNTGAFYKAPDGEMFFGGVNGFNRFYPDKIIENENVPHVFITKFKLLDKEIKSDSSFIFNKNITISYFDKFFSVEFAALDFTDPAMNQYEYKLERFDDGWIKSGRRRYASYTNLSPGNYILKVRGSNNDGVWNLKGTELAITVTPPFWLESWFLTSAAIILLVILVYTVRYYSTKKLKEQIYQLEKEKAVQSERERISRDLHDNVGSQLTNIISGVSLAETYNKTKKQKANDLLNLLKGELRETMTQLRETIWALKSNEMDFDNFINELQKLIERNTKYFPGAIKSDISENKNVLLKPLQALFIFRIIQEAINNSIKHSGADKITVSVFIESKKFCVSIIDNGKGIVNKTSKMINGNGIENMKRRAEEIGAEFSINSEKNKGVQIFVKLKI